VIVATNDPVLSEVSSRRAGERAGARIVVLQGEGHWWMLSDPVQGARVLEDFWSSISTQEA
jgi:hypothetical protein